MALRQEIVEHEKKAVHRRCPPDPRLVQNTESMFIRLVKAGQTKKVNLEVWPHERVWRIHLVSCTVFGGSIEETYLTVHDSEQGEDMLIFEAIHSGEEAEFRYWWPEKEVMAVKIYVRQVKSGRIPVQH